MRWVGKDITDNLVPTLLPWAKTISTGPEDPKGKLKEQSLLVQCLRVKDVNARSTQTFTCLMIIFTWK